MPVPTAAFLLSIMLAAVAQRTHIELVVGLIHCLSGELGLVGIYGRRRVFTVNWDICWQLPALLALIVLGVAISETHRFGGKHR